MSPALRHLVAWDMAATHATLCPHCQPPSVDRPMTRRCSTGMVRDAAILRTWRAQVLALTDRAAR